MKLIKTKYFNKRLMEIHLLNSNGNLWFEIFNFEKPYNAYQTDSIKDLLDYIETQILEEI